MTIDANDLERMAKERPDECFLKGSGVLKLIGGIRQLEAEIRGLRAAAALSPAAELAGGQHLEGDAKLTHQQCVAVADMATQLAEVHRDFARMIVAAPTAMPLEVTGPGTAATMEILCDILNGMDAVTSDDDWLAPILEQAHARWPSGVQPSDGGQEK